MLIADMIHSCSNVHVAKAAVSCIGGSFAERVGRAASKNGMDAGRLVSIIVRNFARRANEESLASLQSSVAGSDQPLLCGLIFVVEPALEALEDDASLYDEDEAAYCPDLRRRGVFCAGVLTLQ